MDFKSTGKTKKRLTIEEYIDNPTADVDIVIGKKQKISSKQWDIVHYFYQKLDNIHYLDHNQHQKELIFQKSEYVDTLIERVLNVNKTVQLPLNNSQQIYFEVKRDAYYQQIDAETKKKEQEYDENSKNMFNKSYQDCSIKDEEDYYANELEYQRKDGNRVKCQRCGRHLHHVFIAQHSENYKKMLLGRECVKFLIPEAEWENFIKKEKKMEAKIKRLKKYIERNNFDLQEYKKKAAITDASLIKQIILVEYMNPELQDEDDIIKKAIDTLCVLRLETMKTYFFEWKNRRFRLNNLSRLIKSSETKKLKRSLKKWCRFVRSFKEQITFKNMSASAIEDRTNAVICLLQQQEPWKECYLELSNISLSVHKGYATYIKIYSDNNDILRTISRIEEELRCTRLTVPSYPLTLKHTDRTVFCTSNGVLMKPCFNQVYENCTVSILLKTYDFDNSTGVSRVCVSVRTSHIL